MAINLKFQLSKGKGLGKAIVFHGLEYKIVVHPTIHGEPILTSQAFYYLDHLEAVAEIRFERMNDRISDRKIEYIIDNYLFAYSKKHDSSRMSTKVTEPLYWSEDYTQMYLNYDKRSTEVLVLDKFNDESVLSIDTLEENDKTDFNDWCLVKNYSDEIIEDYTSKMNSLIHKKIMIKVLPTEDRDGYFGKMRLLNCDDGLLNYYQAQMLDSRFSPRDIEPDQKQVILKPYLSDGQEAYISVESLFLDKLYNPTLLSYYFSGLKELNPLLSYVGFYNVLEYYFEEAPNILQKKARFEREQLQCVISWLKSEEEISAFFKSKGTEFLSNIENDIETSSSVNIKGFKISGNTDLIVNLSNWLYSIRCSIVHSKKSRKGSPTSIFEPYSEESSNIKHSLPIIKWLAIACIEKDQEIGS